MTYRDPRYVHIEDLPHVVYIYWRDDEPLYVGMTSNIEQRMRTHRSTPWDRDCTHIDIWHLDCKRPEAEAVEAQAIWDLSPTGNRLGKFNMEDHLGPYAEGPLTLAEHEAVEAEIAARWASMVRAVNSIPPPPPALIAS